MKRTRAMRPEEVASGYECGMQVEKFNDIKVGDIIECFVMEQIKE